MERSRADRVSRGAYFNRVAAIVSKAKAAAVRLRKELKVKSGARHIERDPLTLARGAYADAAHAQFAVAECEKMRALRLPAGRLPMARTEDAVSGKRVPCVGKPDAAIAELLLKYMPGFAGKHVGRGVRIAPLQHAHSAGGHSADLVARIVVSRKLSKEAIERTGERDGVIVWLLQPLGDLINQFRAPCRIDALHIIVNACAAMVAVGCRAVRCGVVR